MHGRFAILLLLWSIVATAPAAAQSFPFEAPPVGTRFYVSSGARILQYDRSAIDGIWPLAVGKSISFDESGLVKQGVPGASSAWSSAIKVLRSEAITVPAGSFDAFVIEWRHRGSGRNSYDAVLTMWYAPRARFIVKRSFEQIAGPPSSSMTGNWSGFENRDRSRRL